MSLSTAGQSLRTSIADLNAAVAELVMIVHEDRPVGSEVAVVDHLAEMVSELQGAVVAASEAIAGATEPRALPERLPLVADSLGTAARHYWRDLRSYEVMAELRRCARGRSTEWRSWQGSVEASISRCDQPLSAVQAALSAGWQEVGELLVLYLPAPEAASSNVSPSTTWTRRTP